MTPDDEEDREETEYHPESDEAGTFWCPKCGSEMYGDAVRCPKCGDFVNPGARPSSRMPLWMKVGLILIALALAAGLLAAALR